MRERLSKIKRLLCCAAGAFVLAVSAIPSLPAQAEEISPGIYSVKVTSTYQNPDTGVIDDVGQNPAIGQTMVQAQVQTVGRVEIMDDGTIYLDTRWNQADANIYAGFKTSSDLSQTWVDRDFEVTNQLEAGTYEFQGNTFEATVTDYRIQLDTLSDTIRCTNYVEAMAREVVWFCYISEISDYDESSWLNVEAPSIDANTMNQVADTYAAQQSGSGTSSGSSQGGSSSGTSSSTKKPSASSSGSDSDAEDKGKGVDGLKDREVAEAKTASAEDLLESSSGISGVKDDSSDTETISASTGTIVLVGIICLAVGAGIAGAVAFAASRKRRNYQDLFADVDDTDGKAGGR